MRIALRLQTICLVISEREPHVYSLERLIIVRFFMWLSSRVLPRFPEILMPHVCTFFPAKPSEPTWTNAHWQIVTVSFAHCSNLSWFLIQFCQLNPLTPTWDLGGPSDPSQVQGSVEWLQSKKAKISVRLSELQRPPDRRKRHYDHLRSTNIIKYLQLSSFPFKIAIRNHRCFGCFQHRHLVKSRIWVQSSTCMHAYTSHMGGLMAMWEERGAYKHAHISAWLDSDEN